VREVTLPDQNGPQTPGINNLLFETAMWQVDVPQTNTIRWHIDSSSDTDRKKLVRINTQGVQSNLLSGKLVIYKMTRH
jgi:hypothetical protein